MKMKRVLYCVIVLALYAGLASGCDWMFGDQPKDGEIPENVSFYTGCPFYFFFVDENGDSIIDIDDSSTYPVAFRGAATEAACEHARATVQPYEKDGEKLFLYNNSSNSLQWVEEEQMYAFQTFFYGETPQLTYTFPVYWGDDYDTITVGFKYVTTADKVEISGASWAVDVISVLYNDVDILTGNINGKVFVEKPSQGGETVVKINSL